MMTETERAPRVVGETDGDRQLAALGITRLAIPVPFVQAGGPVNVYLIENRDGSLTQFDSGLGTEESLDALWRGFEEAGKRPEDVREIVVSHGHVDHYGGADAVVKRSGARVRIHPLDLAKVTGQPHEEAAGKYRAYFRKLGVPDQRIRELMGATRMSKSYARRLPIAETIEDGERLTFKHFEARVVHMPGHTPGLICLFAEAQRLVFTDDHLLARVSPNPLLELGERGEEDKFRALEAYLASVRRLRELDADWVLPGHNPPFQGHRAIIDSLLGFYDRRQQRMVDAIAQAPRTAFELIREVFGQADAVQLFLMLSEIVGNLEVLEVRGEVRRLRDDGPYRWTVAQ